MMETHFTFAQKLQNNSIKSAQKQKGNKGCKHFISCVQLWPEYESGSFIVSDHESSTCETTECNPCPQNQR